MASSSGSKRSSAELDLSNAGRGIWLVKVPKYIANKWEKAPGSIEVGKLKITRNPGQKAQVAMSLSESLFCLDNDTENEKIPKKHRLDLTQVTRQTLGVFSQSKEKTKLDDPTPEKIVLEGRIVQKLECRPHADEDYMKMKLESFRKAHIPTRTVQHLDRVVQTYKPVSTHKHLKEYEEKKKAEGKRSRDDRNAVMEMLFKAFERHQYYNIKDLVQLTKQPVGYLKEILKEVCNHNMKNPHKNMWELKPEYRHYKEPEASTSTSK